MANDKPEKPIEYLGIKHDEIFTLQLSWRVLRHSARADPWMRRKAVNYLAPRLALAISILVAVVHFIWAVGSECGVNFARVGGIITFTAAALYAVREWHEPKTGLLSGGEVERIHIWNPLFLLPLLAAIGTLIWAYGDLLPWLSSKGCHM
ncbi:hypothetical protein [Mesorhizobium sp. B2-6-2]|uniref:hypothetical protein n=1 Tax=Mesorhizobium sp. B2-6-2 TaxID=2589915 RepID=UPI00112DFEB3|nr:hypothetical protein [Mesorhizobium sp. B2-6-2]TPJ77180.1 hypothetical protein FJ419_16795 [Mesorhizobium sp. B2-6-2]